MELDDNFYWIAEDINKCLILKIYTEDDIFVFDAADMLQATGEDLDVRFANIYDMTDLLTVGIVRFKSINDNDKRIDIPFRNLYMLFDKGGSLEDTDKEIEFVNLNDVDGFSVIGDVKILPLLIEKPSLDLVSIVYMAKNFSKLDMDDKFKALTDMNDLNYKRIKEKRILESIKASK